MQLDFGRPAREEARESTRRYMDASTDSISS
jgi:hypothetical protein